MWMWHEMMMLFVGQSVLDLDSIIAQRLLPPLLLLAIIARSTSMPLLCSRVLHFVACSALFRSVLLSLLGCSVLVPVPRLGDAVQLPWGVSASFPLPLFR